jgi:diguanylate cyclase (GGDEF)-like protein
MGETWTPGGDRFVMSGSEQETSSRADHPDSGAWPILIVDDDKAVHTVISFSLATATILDRGVRLLHAYSAQEAIAILKAEPRISVILLDVVMETETAGLDLVRTIRQELKRDTVRIIVNTGQPGQTTELEALNRYDINDFRIKTELTHNRLLSTLTIAIRSFIQLERMEATRLELTQMVGNSADLFSERSIARFTSGILLQLHRFIPDLVSGLILGKNPKSTVPQLSILAATGAFTDLIGQTLDQITDLETANALRRALSDGVTRFESHRTVMPVRMPSGQTAIVLLTSDHDLDLADQRLIGLFAINTAIGFDNVQLFEHTQELAFTDQLTGLANRTRFLELGNVALKRADPIALFLVDLDGFQLVNDGLGSDIGNQVLSQIGRLICNAIRDAISVARLSGDLFAIMAPAGSEDRIDSILLALASCIEDPLTLAGMTIPLAATIGFTVGVGIDAISMLQQASIALKQGKRSLRGGATRFMPAMDEALRTHMELIAQLRGAMAGNHFHAFLQPIVRLSDGKLMGAEALMRWIAPSGRMIPPDSFIRAAEDSGMIVALGDWMICEVCRLITDFDNQGLPPLRIAVNVSMRQFREAGFVGRVDEILRGHRVSPDRLIIEITESALMADYTGLIEALKALRKMGVGLSIDDFGTGYSSLSYLLNLPVTKLKIDKSFIAEIDRRRESRAIASMIVTMAKELGVGVVAEGVETTGQAAVLMALKCDEAQGWLYAKAMSAKDFAEFARQESLRDESGSQPACQVVSG